MDCPKCKCHIDKEEARFCGNCGTLLRRDTYSEEPQKSGQGEVHLAGQSQKRKTQKKQSSQAVILLAGGVAAALESERRGFQWRKCGRGNRGFA